MFDLFFYSFRLIKKQKPQKINIYNRFVVLFSFNQKTFQIIPLSK